MGESVACLSLGVWWLPAPLGIPWLVNASLQTVSIVTWHHLLCACVHISFGRTPFIGMGSHHDNTWTKFDYICKDPISTIRHVHNLGVCTSTYLFAEDATQPPQPQTLPSTVSHLTIFMAHISTWTYPIYLEAYSLSAHHSHPQLESKLLPAKVPLLLAHSRTSSLAWSGVYHKATDWLNILSPPGSLHRPTSPTVGMSVWSGLAHQNPSEDRLWKKGLSMHHSRLKFHLLKLLAMPMVDDTIVLLARILKD